MAREGWRESCSQMCFTSNPLLSIAMPLSLTTLKQCTTTTWRDLGSVPDDAAGIPKFLSSMAQTKYCVDF